MLDKDSSITDVRLGIAKALVESFGPEKLAEIIQGHETDLDSLAFMALVGAWKSDQNVIRTAMFTAYALGRKHDDNSRDSQ